MTNCPVCNTQVNEKAKFCGECGSQLSKATSERAWIVAMQERIRSARHNDGLYNVLVIVGILLAVAIPFVMRFVLHFTMDATSWSLTAVGAVLLIGSVIGMWFDSKKVKELIAELEAGPQEIDQKTEEKPGEEKTKEDEESDGE